MTLLYIYFAWSQCDQIALFLTANYQSKVAQMFSRFLALYKNSTFKLKTVRLLLAKLSYFLF